MRTGSSCCARERSSRKAITNSYWSRAGTTRNCTTRISGTRAWSTSSSRGRCLGRGNLRSVKNARLYKIVHQGGRKDASSRRECTLALPVLGSYSKCWRVNTAEERGDHRGRKRFLVSGRDRHTTLCLSLRCQ